VPCLPLQQTGTLRRVKWEMRELLHTFAQKTPVGERDGPCWASSLAAAAQAIAHAGCVQSLPKGNVVRPNKMGPANNAMGHNRTFGEV
jgi:hypothetical protein